MIATVFSSLNCGSRDGGHALEALHAVVDLLRRLRIVVHVHDDREWAVEAGAEALGEQVVGLAGRLLLRLRALVRSAQTNERRRRRQGQDRRAARPRTRLAREPSRTGPSGRSCVFSRAGLGVVDRAAGTAPSAGRPCARAAAARRSGASSRSAPSSGRRAREPMPSLVTKSRPKKARPVTEIATVRPAKSTARPAEAPASARGVRR